MMALLVPSRMEVNEYQTYLEEIMAAAGMINADFSDEFWEPTRIIIGSNYARAVAALQLYDVLLVNPITDGMNLVAKEGALLNDRGGVLVLSEHAGAFYELGEHALTISPFDVYGTAEALHRALTMPPEERYRRAAALQAQVRSRDVTRWFHLQVDDALKAFASASRNHSTPETPETSQSALSATADGVSSDATPTPKA
jgi:trehalose 6-phosphate synthase